MGQIHDSIIADVPEKEVSAYITMAKEIMIDRLKNEWKWIITPLEVEPEVAPVGLSWFKKEKYEG